MFPTANVGLQSAGVMAQSRFIVNGEPRSDVKTNGDLGSCSRANRRKARNSSPKIGCVEPFRDPADGKRRPFEVDLIPAQVHELADAGMAVGHKDHELPLHLSEAFTLTAELGRNDLAEISDHVLLDGAFLVAF
jgi:hypothetical protein